MSTGTKRSARTIIAGVCLCMALAACGGDDDVAAEATPTPTPTPTANPFMATPSEEPTDDPTDGGGSYVVGSGDTLGSIAIRFDTTIDAIIELNGLEDPDRLAIGDELRIPGGATGGTDATDDATESADDG